MQVAESRQILNLYKIWRTSTDSLSNYLIFTLDIQMFFLEIGRNGKFLLTTMVFFFHFKKYSSTPTMCEKFTESFRTHSDPFISDDFCCYSQPRFDEAAKFFSSESKNLFRNQNSLDWCNLRSGLLTASIHSLLRGRFSFRLSRQNFI